MKRILFILIPTLFALVTTLSSCDFVREPGVPCPPGSDDFVRFQFRVASPNIRGNVDNGFPTRNDSEGHDETDSEFPAFEDAINIRNFAFYVYLGAENEAPLLIKVTDIATTSDPDMMITGSNGAYTISFVIPKEDLEQKLGRELDPSNHDPIQLRVVGLANIQNFNAEYFPDNQSYQLYRNVPCATYCELIDNASKWTYNLNQIYSPNEEGHVVDGMYKNYIPMFGNLLMTTTEYDIYHSRADNRLWFGTMWMLRSIAKTHVIDNIKSKDKDGYPYISDAMFVGSSDSCYPLPFDAINYQNEQQVHSPRVCASSGEAPKGFPLNSFMLGKLNGGDPDLWIGYAPEMAITGAETVPEFRIKIKFSKDSELTYVVPLTEYQGSTGTQQFNFGSDILRNHIYSLSVNDVKAGFLADISISVKDWEEQSLTLDYTETVNVAETIEWLNGDGFGYGNAENINEEEGWVVAQPWHAGAPVPLTCTFGLTNPAGATWTASLITTEGAQGAFAFLDADGNQVHSVSGTIDGKTLSTLRIVTTNSEPHERSSAYLQIIVSVNGQFFVADICDKNYSYDYFSIIQNPL